MIWKLTQKRRAHDLELIILKKKRKYGENIEY